MSEHSAEHSGQDWYGRKWRKEQRCTNSAGVGSPEARSQHSDSLLTGAGSRPAPRCSPGDLSDDIKPPRAGILSSFLHNMGTWGYVTSWPLAVYNELLCSYCTPLCWSIDSDASCPLTNLVWLEACSQYKPSPQRSESWVPEKEGTWVMLLNDFFVQKVCKSSAQFAVRLLSSTWSLPKKREERKEEGIQTEKVTWGSLLHLIHPEEAWSCWQRMLSMMNIKMCKSG